MLVEIKDHVHAVGHSYRSKVAIEPYLSEQWFVKMKPLAEESACCSPERRDQTLSGRSIR